MFRFWKNRLNSVSIKSGALQANQLRAGVRVTFPYGPDRRLHCLTLYVLTGQSRLSNKRRSFLAKVSAAERKAPEPHIDAFMRQRKSNQAPSATRNLRQQSSAPPLVGQREMAPRLFQVILGTLKCRRKRRNRKFLQNDLLESGVR